MTSRTRMWDNRTKVSGPWWTQVVANQSDETYTMSGNESEFVNDYTYLGYSDYSGRYWTTVNQYEYYGTVYGRDNDSQGDFILGNDLQTVSAAYAHQDDSFEYDGPGWIDRTLPGFDDIIYGLGGDDIIAGRGGRDTIFGGDGNDTIFIDVPTTYSAKKLGSDDASSGTVSSYGDWVEGGAGADTFVIGGNTISSSTDITKNPYNFAGLAAAAATDIAGAIIDGNELSKYWKVGKGVMGAVIDVINGFQGVGRETETVVNTPSNLEIGQYIEITDFNPSEDVIVIPVNKSLSNVDVEIGRDGNLHLSYLTGSEGGNTFAVISLDKLSSIYNNDSVATTDGAEKEIWESVLLSMFKLDSEEDTATIGGMELSTLNMTGSGDFFSKLSAVEADYLVIGAYEGAKILGTNSAEMDLWGTIYSDTLISYSAGPIYNGEDATPADSREADKLYGFAGDDVLAAGGGDDFYYGGEGFDIVSFADEDGDYGVKVNLSETTFAEAEHVTYIEAGNNGAWYSEATDTYGDTDKLYGIEGIIGSANSDEIIGGIQDNILIGGAGNDFLDGGSGIDTVSFADAEGGIVVRLGKGIVEDDGFGDRDALSRIENIIGSDHDDIISGGGANSTLNGFNNVFNGGKGNDTIRGEFGNDTVIGGEGDDFLTGGTQNDILIGGSGADFMNGNQGNDTFKFSWGELGEGDVIRNFESGDKIVIDTLPLGSLQASLDSDTGVVSIEQTLKGFGGFGRNKPTTVIGAAFTLEGDLSGFSANSVEFV